jgi:hypothetical protein
MPNPTAFAKSFTLSKSSSAVCAATPGIGGFEMVSGAGDGECYKPEKVAVCWDGDDCGDGVDGS